MSRSAQLFLTAPLLCCHLPGSFAAPAWQPVGGNIMTKWAKEVTPDSPLPEYPRPQMRRTQWLNLNGLWGYAIRPREAASPGRFDGNILVPFCAESALSGVKKPVGEGNRLWYRRLFDVPASWAGKRVLLHFGAVDWEATVWVNGKELGVHRGGYDPFSFDLTDVLNPTGPQQITVAVWDPTSSGTQPRGKQVNQPKGIWYTAVTGLWQTVWLEPVPQAHIESLHVVPNVDAGTVTVTTSCRGAEANCRVSLALIADGKLLDTASESPNESVEVPVPNARLWSPDSPFLYQLKVSLYSEGETVDEVRSYFGMRKIALQKDQDGIQRLALNGKIGFQYGPLDQGWWPDGLYTAPTDKALRFDLETTKKLGFNMIRKHVKVEPARWYYHCDKLGLLVWQDMPSANRRKEGNQERDKQFEREWKALIEARRNHPSIIMWVLFNEGWGQYDTERLTDWTKQFDPSRLVNNASGWTDKQVGDILDLHSYPAPRQPKPEEHRAVVQGEFGGLGWPVKNHLWWTKRNWGYRTYEDRAQLADNYAKLLQQLRQAIAAGTAAAVYTQTTDCEGEVNGLMTYDRAVVKFDPAWMAALNRKLYLPPPLVRPLVPTSEKVAWTWRYTTTKPAAGWEKPDFEDSGWQQGKGGFGTESTPGAVVGTTWNSSDLWIRRVFQLGEVPKKLSLRMHHDEDAEVYLNGVPAAQVKGYTTGYVESPLPREALAALRPGENLLAAHCHQTTGGQFLDLGLVQVIEQAP